METGIHRIVFSLKRAAGGVRRRPWLHLLSTITLAAAFLSFGATLTAAVNLDNLLSQWIGTAELTVYLKDGSTSEEVNQLSSALEKIDSVERVSSTSQVEARDNFAKELGALSDTAQTLPVAAFPASIDVHLKEAASRNMAERKILAARLAKVELVKDVDLYDDWFERLSALTLVGRLAAWGLGLIALLVAILVVAAIVRSGISTRIREIQVLRTVGATEHHVRMPFLLEGTIEATLAMAVAIGGLHFLTNIVQEIVGEIIPLVGASHLITLAPTTIIMMLAGSAVAGLIGSRFSLRSLEHI
jgi:cell division transport system permease protein